MWIEYQSITKFAEERTNEARERFLQNKVFEALDSKKNIWKELQGLGLLPKAKEGLHGFSPDEMNALFAGVSISQSKTEEELSNIAATASEDGFKYRTVSFVDVVLAVAHFSSQAKGEDGIPLTVIAKALPYFGHHLVTIFNASLKSGVFPSAWKSARLVPLKKTNTPSAVSDFRPIALLCFLSKVLERIFHEQMSEHLKAKNILDPLQSGFHPNHSTQTALLKLTEDIRQGIDSNKQLMTALLLFDFSKAFDTISPSKLLKKLIQMGFSNRVVPWVKSYLSNRRQRVTTPSSGDSD